MVLATAFAACTNEEIVENVAVDDVQGRLEFAAPAVSVGNGVESRFEWDAVAGQWKEFTANDKFSAGLMDVAKFTTLTDAPLTNYVFSSANGGETYTTTSKMKEGVYFFYSYPGFEKESERVAVPFDLTESQEEIDLANPTANVNENQLFVSALYKVEAKNADLAVPVQFYSYWSTAGLKIKNTTSQDIKIVRIVLKGATDTQFLVKGTLTPSSLGTPSVKNAELENEYIYYCEDGKYVLPYKDLDDKTKGRVDADGIKTATIATAATDGNQGAIMVDVKNGTVAAGETTVAYIQMPAATYAEGSITAKIHVEVYDEIEEENVVKELEAEFVTNHSETKDGVTTEYIRLRRGHAYSAFGAEPFVIDELGLNVAQEGIGAYAASYEDLYQLVVKENQKKIYNIGSLKMDDQAITLLNRLYEKDALDEYQFQNPIVITSDKKSVALNIVVFLAGASLEKGKLTLGNNAVPAEKTLVVGDEAELTINKTQSGTIENHNKVTVNAAKTGTITVGKDEEGEAHITEVVIAHKAATVDITGMAAPYKWTVNKEVTVKLPKDADGLYTNPWGTTIVNNGTIVKESTGTFINKGTITNNATGVIDAVRNAGSYDATRTSNKLQTASIDNYGVITHLMPFEYSLVTMKAEDAVIDNVHKSVPATGTTDNGGEIDNTVSGFVTLASGNTQTVVYAKYTSDVKGNLPRVQAQNAAKLVNCTWDLTGLTSADDSTTPITECTELKDLTKGIELSGVTVKKVNSSTGAPLSFNFGTLLTEATTTAFNCVPTIYATTADADHAIDFTGSTFKGALTLKTATYATLGGVTFEAGAAMNDLTALNLYGTVNVKGALSASSATTMTIGKLNADATYTATTVKFDDNVTISTSATAVKVLTNAKMSLAVGKKLNAASTTEYTVNGVVDNKGAIQGKAAVTISGTGAKWNGDKPVASF